MERNRRNDACERGGTAARRFPPSSHRKPVLTKTVAMFEPGSEEGIRTRWLGTPRGPRPDVLAPGSSEITEGFGDHRNPP